MSKQKTLATAPAKIARRLSYFIDVIGRSGFQGGYQWAFRQLDGSWKIWRCGVGEASAPPMTPTRSSIGSRSNCNAAPSAEMAVPPRRLTTVVQSSAALMMSRKHLPDRRRSEILELELHGLRNTASFSRFVAEVYADQQKKFLQKEQESYRTFPANTRSILMSNEQTKNENLPMSFDGGGGSNRIIQGTLLRCTDGHWADREGIAFDHPLLALATTQALQRWENQTPIETIMKNPGEPLPVAKELNDRIPQTEWEEGLNGEPRPPWVLQHIVYMLDPRDASTFTFINGTIGARIAVERLADRVKWMRALRGERVVPVVKLDTKPMTTRFGQKMRPEFTILEWRQLGVNQQHEAAPQLTHAGEQVGQSVKPVTTKEALNDEIPF